MIKIFILVKNNSEKFVISVRMEAKNYVILSQVNFDLKIYPVSIPKTTGK